MDYFWPWAVTSPRREGQLRHDQPQSYSRTSASLGFPDVLEAVAFGVTRGGGGVRQVQAPALLRLSCTVTPSLLDPLRQEGKSHEVETRTQRVVAATARDPFWVLLSFSLADAMSVCMTRGWLSSGVGVTPFQGFSVYAGRRGHGHLG